jgi:DNA-binding NarL/FixJ family response regulator
LPSLRTIVPGLKVIAVSGRPEVARTAMAGGANAFVSKSEGPECLLEAVNSCWE